MRREKKEGDIKKGKERNWKYPSALGKTKLVGRKTKNGRKEERRNKLKKEVK